MKVNVVTNTHQFTKLRWMEDVEQTTESKKEFFERINPYARAKYCMYTYQQELDASYKCTDVNVT